jgi:hypothetical protein
MSDVLAVTAFEQGHPVARLVRVEGHDGALHDYAGSTSGLPSSGDPVGA